MKTIFITLLAFMATVGTTLALEVSIEELRELIAGNQQEQSYGAYTGMVDGENYNVGVRIFNGANYNRFIASTTLSSDVTWSLPTSDGTNGQALTTDGGGNLTFTTAGTPSLTLGNIFVGNSSNEATATTTIFVTNEKVGVGTTTPLRTLDVFGTFGVSGATTLNTVAYTWPSSDGTANFSLTTNGAGQLAWSDVSKASTSDTVVFNTTANEAITKGDAVYVSGELSGLPLVNKADADDSSKMPALGLSATTVASGSALQVIQTGRLTGFDTSSYTAGDALYIATSSGALVNYRPSDSTELVQKIAQVENSDASGNIIIFGAGRSNDVPNIFTMNRATSTDFTVTGNLKAGTVISGTWQGTDVGVEYGGTGASTLTDHGVLVGSGTGAITALTVGTNGQLLIGSTGADPVFGTLNCDSNLTCTTGAGTLEIDLDGDIVITNLTTTNATTTKLYVGGDIVRPFVYWKGTLLASSTESLAGANATSTFELPTMFENVTVTDILCRTDTGTSSIAVNGEYLECDSDNTEDDGSIASPAVTKTTDYTLGILFNKVGNPLQTTITIKAKYDEY